MSLTASNEGTGKDYDPVPAGVHAATCVRLFDLGTHHNTVYDKYQPKLMICWELPDETMEIEVDGVTETKPRWVSQEYTNNLGDKANLRHMLESWRGVPFTPEELQGFDLSKLLGAPCQIQVTHKPTKKGKIWANVQNVMACPKGMAVTKPADEPTLFEMPENGDIEVPADVPAWIGRKIQDSEEFKERGVGAVPQDQSAENRVEQSDLDAANDQFNNDADEDSELPF